MTENLHHILLVEDEPTLLRGLLRGLESVPSLRMTGCPTVEDAIDELEQEVPDLLITDLNLPGLSGLDLVDYLTRRSIHIPVIVMTAFHSDYKERLSGRLGLTVLEKPVRLADLRQLIENELQRVQNPLTLGPFAIADYIQMACLGRHSLVIDVALADDQRGVIEIFEGEIWSAKLNDLPPNEALFALLYKPLIQAGYMPIHEPPKERHFTKRWEGILLEAATLRDESIRDDGFVGRDGPPSDTDFSAVLEGVDFLSRELDAIRMEPSSDQLQEVPSYALTPLPLFLNESKTNEFYAVSASGTTPEALMEPASSVSEEAPGDTPHHVNTTKEFEMAKNNIQECLQNLTELDGFVGACLVDSSSGMALGSVGGGNINLAVAAASNSEVVKSKRKAIKNLRLTETIEDILITLNSQYHLIRPSSLKDELFFYLVLDRKNSNLALARMGLTDIEGDLRL